MFVKSICHFLFIVTLTTHHKFINMSSNCHANPRIQTIYFMKNKPNPSQIQVGRRPHIADGIRTSSEDGTRPIYCFHYMGRILSSEIVRSSSTICGRNPTWIWRRVFKICHANLKSVAICWTAFWTSRMHWRIQPWRWEWLLFNVDGIHLIRGWPTC